MYLWPYLGASYAGEVGDITRSPVQVELELVTVVVIRRPVAAFARRPVLVEGADPPLPVPQPHPARVIAQHIRTGEFVDWEFPLADVEVTKTLSGADQISGRVAPEVGFDELGIEPWGTWLHVEEAGQIRASGIVQPFEIESDDEVLRLDAVGFTGYLDGIPYLGEYSRTDVDPWEVVGELWSHVQSYPDGDMGVVVDPGSTPVRLGNETNEDGEVEPYELMWWDAPDCGRELSDLADEGMFEFVERNYWNEPRTDVEHHLVLGYPRHGRRRHDLRFAHGENVLSLVPLVEPEDVYASQVVVLGSGEGREMVRASQANRLGSRLRRVQVVEDKTIKHRRRARARADEVLSRAQASLLEISEIEVDARHENAKLGSFQVGDQIPVGPVDVPFKGTVRLWHRIMSYTYELDGDRVRLELSRKDANRRR